MGSLRGVAHAGRDGNVRACVAAFKLVPTQLRIAGFIARSADGNTSHSTQPEIAKINKGVLCVEPYLHKK